MDLQWNEDSLTKAVEVDDRTAMRRWLRTIDERIHEFYPMPFDSNA